MFFMSPLFHFIGFLYHTYLCHKETFSNEAHYSHNLLEFSKCMKCVPEHEKYLIYKVVGGFFIPPANLYLYTYFMHVLKPIKLFFFLSFYYGTKIFISSDCDGKKFMKRNLLGNVNTMKFINKFMVDIRKGCYPVSFNSCKFRIISCCANPQKSANPPTTHIKNMLSLCTCFP